MSFFADGLRQAWELIVSGDSYLWGATWVTIKVAVVSTLVALLLGLPPGLALGIGRFRGRGLGQALANAGLGLPPVVVGLVLALLMFPAAPLGPLRLLFTLKAVYIAQTVLAWPIVVALTSSAVRSLPPGLLDQARAFGATGVQLATLALREARIGVLAATIAALGSGLAEVGAVVLVGGNIERETQTLASAALEQVQAGRYAYGFAIGIILLALIVVIMTALTWLQSREGRIPRVRAPS